VAGTIHAQSSRKDKVFLPVNCSAIPDTLLESQLFGLFPILCLKVNFLVM